MNDAELTLKIEDEITDKYTWATLLPMIEGGASATIPSGRLKLDREASKTNRLNDNGYGEWPMGSTDEVWMILILENTDGLSYFKKLGTADSYGEVYWDGKFRMVTPQAKTVTVYEYVGA